MAIPSRFGRLHTLMERYDMMDQELTELKQLDEPAGGDVHLEVHCSTGDREIIFTPLQWRAVKCAIIETSERELTRCENSFTNEMRYLCGVEERRLEQ